MHGNLLYAQSGGVTSVINQSAAGAILQARTKSDIRSVYVAQNGVNGILQERLFDCSRSDLGALAYSPGGYFGSCRYKLPAPGQADYKPVMDRIIEVFQAHNIRFFLYNGGGDSQDTLLKIALYAKERNYRLYCVGIPKTIDNDLVGTDNSPGFGSAAKYLALSTAEVACDLRAMHHDSTKLVVMEVMGRNTGWLAAATSLAGDIDPLFEPDAIVLPERSYQPQLLLKRCRQRLAQKGFCLVIVAEGIVDQEHHHLSPDQDLDAFGHPQLGGITPKIANYLKRHLGVKTHWAIPAYLQRSARHLVSANDLRQAEEVARAAVDLAVKGVSEVMVTIRRQQDAPYIWHIDQVPLHLVANQEKTVPDNFIDQSGMVITEQGKSYLRPLIVGESPPPYTAGLPSYGYCQQPLMAQVLPAFKLH